MIVTIMATFVDAPKGKDEKKYFAGDVVSLSTSDFDRISSQNKNLLKKGKHNLGTGICYPCMRNKKKTTNDKI